MNSVDPARCRFSTPRSPETPYQPCAPRHEGDSLQFNRAELPARDFDGGTKMCIKTFQNSVVFSKVLRQRTRLDDSPPDGPVVQPGTLRLDNGSWAEERPVRIGSQQPSKTGRPRVQIPPGPPTIKHVVPCLCVRALFPLLALNQVLGRRLESIITGSHRDPKLPENDITPRSYGAA